MKSKTFHFFKIFFIFFLLYIVAPSQVLSQFRTHKIIDNGSDFNKLVWVIMGDGYTESQLDDFHFDAIEVLFSVLLTPPWLNYISYLNVYLIDVTSDESGADHPYHEIYVDTALDASYSSHKTERLLMVDDAKALDVASLIPTFDMAMVLVNDDQYAGSSGSTVVISNHWLAGRIALHELGHFIGGLADEYENSRTVFPEGDLEPNLTCETERDKIPWNRWINPMTPLPTPDIMSWVVGLFEGAIYMSTDIYRPRHVCMMRNILVPYCEVCTEAIILNIYNYVDPIRNYIPSESIVTFSPDEVLQFKVTLERPLLHPLAVNWELDGHMLRGENRDTLYLDCSNLREGVHTLKVHVMDKTSLVRNDPHHLLSSSHTWIMKGNSL